MKLWLLSQTAADGYDTYDSCVVAAEDEGTAQGICPGAYYEYDAQGKMRYNYGEKELVNYPSWAPDRDAVKVEYLGEAKPDTQRGVICASFNAG